VNEFGGYRSGELLHRPHKAAGVVVGGRTPR